MRRKVWISIAGAVSAALLLTWSAPAVNTISAVPFRLPTSYLLADRPNITLYARGATGWTPFRISMTPPHGLLSSAAALAQYITGVGYYVTIAPNLPGVGPASQPAAFADFAGDRTPGAAYLEYNAPHQVRVALGTAAALFKSNTSIPVGKFVDGMITADFNRDGRADLAVNYGGDGNADLGGVAVFLSAAGGTLGSPAYYAQGKPAASVAALDVNHDNILDLAVAQGSTDPGVVRVLLGVGDGTFTAGASFAVGAYPSSVTIADLNKDTHPDLAVSGSQGVVTVLLGTGTGAFQAGSTFSVKSQNASYVAAGDLNADGSLDLVVTNLGGTITVVRGLGNGTFQVVGSYVASKRPESLVLTDFNLDGKLDIINGVGDQRGLGPSFSSRSMDILLGKGDLTFDGVAAQGFSGGISAFLETADFNGDGRVDAISNDLYGRKLFQMNGQPNGSFAAPVELTIEANGGYDAAAADFNGDGRPDLAVAENFSSMIAVFLNGNNGFQQPTRFSSRGDDVKKIITADFNGDGKADLAVMNSPFPGANKTANVSVFFGGGNGGFNFQQSYNAALFPGDIAAADVNQDGRADLIVTDQGNKFIAPFPQGSVMVYLNNGAGFNAPLKPVTTEHPGAIATGDLNGDGRQDLVFFTENDNFGFRVATMLGNGNGTFQAIQKYQTDFIFGALTVRDFDGDGKSEVVVAHSELGYYRGHGDGTLDEEVLVSGIGSPVDLAVGDFNNDAKPDLLVVVGDSQGSLAALLNTGEGLADIVNSASFSADLTVAPDSIASIFGNHLAAGTALDDTTVTVTDSAGIARPATLYHVFPTLINFVMPAETSTGLARVRIVSKDGVVSSGNVNLATVAPGIYAANGIANGVVIRDDRPGFEYTVQNVNGVTVPKPVALADTGNTFLILYGTGIRGTTKSLVTVRAGNTLLTTEYSGPQGTYLGFDQLNLRLPASLRGAGEVTVTTTVAGKTANSVKLAIQ